jgi:nucleotide-binding universal stress UspA family protein
LHLAVGAARTLGTSLTVATIVPKPWLTPSRGRVDAEYEEWRGYRSYTGKLTRLTCAYSATSDSIDVVRRCVEFAERFGVTVRVLTFAVRGKTMYPPEVGLDVEDSILEAWASQAREIQENLKTEGVVGDDVVLQVVTGHSWKEALDKAEWQDGEIPALGTTPRGDIRRVFLGSRSAKIIRESPVPVLVLPG